MSTETGTGKIARKTYMYFFKEGAEEPLFRVLADASDEAAFRDAANYCQYRFDLENLELSCPRCNFLKGSKTKNN